MLFRTNAERMHRRAMSAAEAGQFYFRMGEWVRLGGYREPAGTGDIRAFCGAARRLLAGRRLLAAYAEAFAPELRMEALDFAVGVVAYLGGKGGGPWVPAAAAAMAVDLLRCLEVGRRNSGTPSLEQLADSVREEVSGFFVGHCLDKVDG